MYKLRLYVVEGTKNSMKAIHHLRAHLEEKVGNDYSLEIIDVLKNPELADRDNILATPTIVKIVPAPIRKVMGDLSNSEMTFKRLGLPN